mmetsp:Transcript_57381/g.124688  ORF Transcript_57381/g.124688 Transcript_57381/m.124688 type:complete len:243 (+) Transcript_57381:195-923(+)
MRWAASAVARFEWYATGPLHQWPIRHLVEYASLLIEAVDHAAHRLDASCSSQQSSCSSQQASTQELRKWLLEVVEGPVDTFEEVQDFKLRVLSWISQTEAVAKRVRCSTPTSRIAMQALISTMWLGETTSHSGHKKATVNLPCARYTASSPQPRGAKGAVPDPRNSRRYTTKDTSSPSLCSTPKTFRTTPRRQHTPETQKSDVKDFLLRYNSILPLATPRVLQTPAAMAGDEETLAVEFLGC